MTSPDMHLDTGALALNALPDDEAAEVEAHLATCDSCPAELAGFRETVALLGSVAAEAPPASLRRAIMARIAVTPQLPPLAPPVAEPVVAPSPPTPPAGPRHAAGIPIASLRGVNSARCLRLGCNRISSGRACTSNTRSPARSEGLETSGGRRAQARPAEHGAVENAKPPKAAAHTTPDTRSNGADQSGSIEAQMRASAPATTRA